MSKYKNSVLYLYQGTIYKRIDDDGDIYYKSSTGKFLSEEQRSKSLFFDSILECETYRHLMFWVNKFRTDNPKSEIKLIRQFPIVLIPESECFPAYKHRVDFALSIKWSGSDYNTVYLIESKGIITKDTMLVLRLLELQYRGISEGRYLMVFARFPDKYPRDFPDCIKKITLENLATTLTKIIKPIK